MKFFVLKALMFFDFFYKRKILLGLKKLLGNDVKIIFEPGRFIVGNTAILITKIIYIKKSNNKNFVILDAGMNNLMRPALYDAHHQIVPIKRTNKLFKGNFEFVGPICESSDKFSGKGSAPRLKSPSSLQFNLVVLHENSFNKRKLFLETANLILVIYEKLHQNH